MDILSEINEYTRSVVAECKKIVLPNDLRKEAEESKPEKPDAFLNALKAPGISVIAEVKKASPSKGVIVENFNPVEIAHDYIDGGAAAISVLTEPKYFQGHLNYLRKINKIGAPPLLRKDFIIDEYQIFEAVTYGASAILLIVASLSLEELADFQKLAHEFNLNALVEIHNNDELEKALKAESRIIGVNNRDLKTFKTTLETSIDLSSQMPQDVVRVSESGIRNRQDIETLIDANFDAVLIGEHLVKQNDRVAFLKELRGV